VATKPVDFRRGADGLAAMAREQFRHDPFSGTFSPPLFGCIPDDGAWLQALDRLPGTLCGEHGYVLFLRGSFPKTTGLKIRVHFRAAAGIDSISGCVQKK
jgi:hypothetical protein